MVAPALDAGELLGAQQYGLRGAGMVSCVADACRVELKVDVGRAALALHEELDAAILVHVVAIPWGERA